MKAKETSLLAKITDGISNPYRPKGSTQFTVSFRCWDLCEAQVIWLRSQLPAIIKLIDEKSGSKVKEHDFVCRHGHSPKLVFKLETPGRLVFKKTAFKEAQDVRQSIRETIKWMLEQNVMNLWNDGCWGSKASYAANVPIRYLLMPRGDDMCMLCKIINKMEEISFTSGLNEVFNTHQAKLFSSHLSNLKVAGCDNRDISRGMIIEVIWPFESDWQKVESLCREISKYCAKAVKGFKGNCGRAPYVSVKLFKPYGDNHVDVISEYKEKPLTKIRLDCNLGSCMYRED